MSPLSGANEQILSTGAIAAALVGSTNIFACYAFGGILIAFFVSSSLLTRLASGLKARLDDEHKRDGQRDHMQVLCNGGVPAALAVWYTVVTACGHEPLLHG
jgi:uncharacterized membrane protein